MSAKVDKFVKTYKSLCQIPSVVGGQFLGTDVILSLWSQRNLERGKVTKFLRTLPASPDSETTTYSPPVDVSNELLVKISPCKKLRAVLREVDTNQFLEVWQNYNLIRTVDFNALDIHGSVYTDVEFSALEWSPDEKKLLYVAEKKLPKSDPFYKRAAKKPENEDSTDAPKPRGEEYLFEQDWGEQLVGKKKSILAQYDVENDQVEILEGIPDSICVAQPTYASDGTYIVGIAYETEPRKLGLIYCSNRPSSVFKLNLTGEYMQLNLKGQAVKSPRFTLDEESLIWLQRKSGGPHACAMSLVKVALPLQENSSPTVIVDVVRSEIKINGGRSFYGLYNTGFPRRCWASGNRLVFSTAQKNTINSYVVDIDSGAVTELEFSDGSLVILDVFKDNILAVRRNFFAIDQLVIAKLPAKSNEETISWVEITPSRIVPGLEDKMYKYLDLNQQEGSVSQFSAIYIGPKSGNNMEYPLLVWPHGGPHSAFSNYLFLEAAIFLSFNYGILLINFRGSLGSGQDSVEFLPGKVGSSDVADCILATDTALKRFPWINPSALGLVGGSHGGFLVTHLSGQFPDKFKAVVARNPVIDIASMSVISDIPDWCYVEGGEEYSQRGPIDNNILLKMREMSPIVHSHKVKAPTLLQIGSKDLRVPMHQGAEYFHRLKANGVTVRMNLYDDNHPLGTVPNEMDNIINTLLWLEEHVKGN